MIAIRRLGRWALVAACFAFAGCDNPQRTIDRLRPEIAAFKAAPSETTQRKIEEDFARLDAQIEKLERKDKIVEAAQFRSVAENLRADYRTAKVMRTMKDAQSAIQNFGAALKDAGKSIGDAFRPAGPTPTPP